MIFVGLQCVVGLLVLPSSTLSPSPSLCFDRDRSCSTPIIEALHLDASNFVLGLCFAWGALMGWGGVESVALALAPLCSTPPRSTIDDRMRYESTRSRISRMTRSSASNPLRAISART